MDQQNNLSNLVDRGQLRIKVNAKSNGIPVDGATVTVSYTGEPGRPIEEIKTDESGNVSTMELDAPPLEYSMSPSEEQPYAEYTVRVQAPGYRPVTISGIQVFSQETSLQNVELEAEDAQGNPIDTIVIPANTLYGNFPPKIPEEEVKSVTETGEIVLSRVVIPEFVIVHDGSPEDRTAKDYYVRYRDYIKNVASSEIYSTWPDATIRANVLAIMSFTLNRVYTEW